MAVIDIQDIRTGTIAGTITYEDGVWESTNPGFMEMIDFYRNDGESDEFILSRIKVWGNNVYQAITVEE